MIVSIFLAAILFSMTYCGFTRWYLINLRSLSLSEYHLNFSVFSIASKSIILHEKDFLNLDKPLGATSVVQLKDNIKDHLNDHINFPAFKSDSFKGIII